LSDLSPKVGLAPPEMNKISQMYRPNSGLPVDQILVAALGCSMRGDDGVGIAVLERLTKCGCLSENIYFQTDGSPINLMNAFLSHKFGTVIIIDSANIHQTPGDWQRFTLNEKKLVTLDENTKISIHNFGLAEVLELCNVLNIELPEIVIYGVQPKEVDFSNNLSDVVQNAVSAIYSSILEDLRKKGVNFYG